MELEPPVNPNYAARVIRVKTLTKLPNSDFLQGVPLFGMQAITDMSTQVGELYVLFPAGVELADFYCWWNSLYRHTEKNFSPDNKPGYIEDNRRVRAVKLRGNRSDCLLLPLSSLECYNIDVRELKEGDTFDCLNGGEVCRKWVNPNFHAPRFQGKQAYTGRIDEKLFPEHFDTPHYLRVLDEITGKHEPWEQVVVTQKLHGTSIRVGNVLTAPEIKWWQKLLLKLHLTDEWVGEYDVVVGSHHALKGEDAPEYSGNYYGMDIHAEVAATIAHLIPKNYVVYGEVVGYLPKFEPNPDVGHYPSIQKNYTYDLLPGNWALYVYRVAVVNEDGVSVDLSWDALLEFCKVTGLHPVPELWRGGFGVFQELADEWAADRHFVEEGYEQAVPLAPESPCDEGVCVRFEGMRPDIYKIKAPEFVQHESKMADDGVIDIEETGGLTAEPEYAIT